MKLIKHREEHSAPFRIALAGNPNSGKSTLFNALTGGRQRVGNFPGVTVERRSGYIKSLDGAELVDLPGVYSLEPYTAEESVTRGYLINERPDAVVNVLSAADIERGLYLTLELSELDIPIVVALTMTDELTSGGGQIDVGALSERLRLPVIPVIASKGEGLELLLRKASEAARGSRSGTDFFRGEIHNAVRSAAHIIREKAEAAKIPPIYAACGALSGTAPKELTLTPDESELIRLLSEDIGRSLGTDCGSALADARYEAADSICKQCLRRGSERGRALSHKIDSVLTHRIFGIPVFIGIMLLIFRLTFTDIGAPLKSLTESAVSLAADALAALLKAAGTNEMLISLITDGIFAGVGSVLSFLPVIMTLFFFLSLLEDSGYMARAAFLLDRPLQFIGLSGRSFVPMLTGFGCTVPAVMSARTLPGERSRKLTILITPFMSCGARLPVYSVIAAAFFAEHAPAVITAMYAVGILAAVFTGIAAKGTVMRREYTPFIMELPPYRLPSMRGVLILMWERGKDFITKAFTVILLTSAAVWFLQSFDLTLSPVSDPSRSILAAIGSAIAPVFAPLGFGDWRAVCALVTGVSAKEAVVSTLSVLTGASGDTLTAALGGVFTPLSAVSFMVFTALYMPCMAAFAAIKRETGLKNALLCAGYETLAAYAAAFAVYNIGRFFV